eukprot:scaffold1108_cov387-Prasinococcus_capsulatus_cf.AAC.16
MAGHGERGGRPRGVEKEQRYNEGFLKRVQRMPHFDIHYIVVFFSPDARRLRALSQRVRARFPTATTPLLAAAHVARARARTRTRTRQHAGAAAAPTQRGQRRRQGTVHVRDTAAGAAVGPTIRHTRARARMRAARRGGCGRTWRAWPGRV